MQVQLKSEYLKDWREWNLGQVLLLLWKAGPGEKVL